MRATQLSFSHEGYRPSTSPPHVLKPQSMPRRSPLPLMTKVGKLGTRVVVLPLRAQNGHAFALGNGFDDAQKGFACSIGAVLPAVAALRPNHQTALVGCELRRHMEPVLGGCGVQYFHMAFSLTTFRYSKITTFCPRLQRVKFSSDSAGCAVLQKIYFYDILCYTI